MAHHRFQRNHPWARRLTGENTDNGACFTPGERTLLRRDANVIYRDATVM
ncbi:hypothetical protein L842_4639 [Mycobacterium intracellulare MIN_052511_1280]|nr:hypothetical protein L842_4639 [Mycobacterium intracellulare MIN_052511_1280]